MMLETIKKEIVTILVGIAAILTIIEQLWKGRWGIKMILDLFPAKIDTFWLLMIIFATIILLANYEKIPLLGRKYKEYKEEVATLKSNFENDKKKFQLESEEEKKHFKSKLEGKRKQYNELLSETSLPKPIEELISIEKMREPSIHGQKHVDDFPTLRFLLRVINYTYYSFEPKDVEIEYYCGGKKVGQNIGSASTLPRYGNGSGWTYRYAFTTADTLLGFIENLTILFPESFTRTYINTSKTVDALFLIIDWLCF